VNIILVSDSLAKSRSMTLSQTQVLLIAFGILLSGFVLAMATYVVTMRFAVDVRNPYLRTLLDALHQDDLKRNEMQTRESLNALAVKVGELQARILRLDAFGERLAKSAGIKRDEFRFEEKPGQGGPAPSPGRELSTAEFQQMLDEISRVLDDRGDKLGALDSLLMDDRLTRKTIPTTMPVAMGYYSSNYGYRLDPFTGRQTFHTGVDLIAPPGTAVVAAAGGVVTTVAFLLFPVSGRPDPLGERESARRRRSRLHGTTRESAGRPGSDCRICWGLDGGGGVALAGASATWSEEAEPLLWPAAQPNRAPGAVLSASRAAARPASRAASS